MRATLIALMLILASQASAEDQYMDLYSDCLDKSGPTNNSGVFGCARETEENALEQIDLLLLDLKEALYDDYERNILMQGQQAWENYIQIQCKLEGTAIGSPMYAYCPMEKAIDRVKQLQRLLGEI